MSLRKIKKRIYQKIHQLIVCKSIMFYVQRVRVKNNMVEAVVDGVIIELPDQEMWAVYKTGEAVFETLTITKEKANNLCDIFNKNLKKTIKLKFK